MFFLLWSVQSQGLIKINIENIQNVGQASRTEVKRSANRNKCFSIRGSKEREKNCIKSACLAKCEAISLMAIYLCCLQYRLTWAICVFGCLAIFGAAKTKANSLLYFPCDYIAAAIYFIIVAICACVHLLT